MTKKNISWILVLLWMIVIFILSDIKGIDSYNKSVGGIATIIDKTVDVTNNIGITNYSDNQSKINNISKKLNYPVRKSLHAIEYLILTLLLYNAFYQSGFRNKKLIIYSILVCFLYACSDEFHQLFRERTGQFSDVILDTFGGCVGLFLIFLVKKIKNHKIKLGNS